MNGLALSAAECDPYNVDYGNSGKDKQRGTNRTILNDNLGDGFEQYRRLFSSQRLSVC